jgi:hypothetical protein
VEPTNPTSAGIIFPRDNLMTSGHASLPRDGMPSEIFKSQRDGNW